MTYQGKLIKGGKVVIPANLRRWSELDLPIEIRQIR